MSDHAKIEVVFVEDNPRAAEMTMRALHKRNLASQVVVLKTGPALF